MARVHPALAPLASVVYPISTMYAEPWSPPNADPAELRRARGWSQPQLAAAAQCSVGAVRRFEERFRPAGVSAIERRILAVLEQKE